MRLVLCGLLALAVAGCKTGSGGGSSAGSGSGNVVLADGSTTATSSTDQRIDDRVIIVNPFDNSSSFQLVRYFLNPQTWQLMKVEYLDDGTRRYVFRRLITGAELPSPDPLAPEARPKTNNN